MSNKTNSIAETAAAVVISMGALVTGTIEAGCKMISEKACEASQVASESLQSLAETKSRSPKD